MRTFTSVTLALIMSVNFALAASIYSDSSSLNNETTWVSVSSNTVLSPVTPREATFEDNIYDDYSSLMRVQLSPETPSVADFSDVVQVYEINPVKLAPVVPSEADFEDSFQNNLLEGVALLSPITPIVADFTDTI